MINTVRVIVSGFGRVGHSFVDLLLRREEILITRYKLKIKIMGVVDISGAIFAENDKKLSAEQLLDALKSEQNPLSSTGLKLSSRMTVDLIEMGIGDVLVEVTPTNIKTGEPGLKHIHAALENRMHVITATKGSLVLDYGNLTALAREKKVALKFSAATAAALPAYDLGAYALAGASINKIEGILNGTTNFILSRMAVTGETYSEALSTAQKLGIAETDPSLDVEGWDSASKLLILANSLLGFGMKLDDIDVSGITGVTAKDIKNYIREWRVPKLIASAERLNSDKLIATVKVKSLSKDNPLASVNGAEKAISYTTDTMDQVTVVGGKSDPLGAAAAMLKDLINLYRERR